MSPSQVFICKLSARKRLRMELQIPLHPAGGASRAAACSTALKNWFISLAGLGSQIHRRTFSAKMDVWMVCAAWPAATAGRAPGWASTLDRVSMPAPWQVKAKLGICHSKYGSIPSFATTKISLQCVWSKMILVNTPQPTTVGSTARSSDRRSRPPLSGPHCSNRRRRMRADKGCCDGHGSMRRL